MRPGMRSSSSIVTGRRQMRNTLVPAAVLAGALLLQPRAAAAGGLLLLEKPGSFLANVLKLIADIDLTLPDEAVTDGELEDCGSDDQPPDSDDSPKLYLVDDDKRQCPFAQFKSINDAILVAPPGTKIFVCPGTYRENVLVSKPGLQLIGPRSVGPKTACLSSGSPDPTREAIVSYDPRVPGVTFGFGIDVEASNVVIQGFTVQPALNAPGVSSFGIFARDTTSGNTVRNNVAQNNSVGIDFNSSALPGAAPGFVQRNCLRNNNHDGGGPFGDGIYSDLGLHNAYIQHNFCTGNPTTCIVLLGSVLVNQNTNIEISHNEAVNDGAIWLVNTRNFLVDSNKVINPSNTGMLFGGGDDGGVVSYNDLRGGAASVHGISIRSDEGGPFVPARNIYVKRNRVAGFPFDGIQLAEGVTLNTVEANRVFDNVMAGIGVVTAQLSDMPATPPTNNTIQKNHLRDNNPDCYDDTVGSGTAGTANDWIRNNGETENRPGLCKKGR